jgi:NAD(P)H dehydrogenase (quinone)
MSTPTILVTGATGKTGTHVVEQLLEQGYPVRAIVRIIDDRSERLEQLGAEIIQADLLALASMRSAVQGVQRIYFCFPTQDDRLVEATTIIATAAREAGVKAFVNMSQLTTRDDAPSRLSRQHWLSENILDWADIGAIHIRPGFFAENLLIFGASTIAPQGMLYLPYGDERHAPLAASDIARVAITLLANPTPHIGQRYVLTGPKLLTIAEMARVLSSELGIEVEYVDLPVEQWGSIIVDQLGQTQFLADHLMAVARVHQEGEFNKHTDLVEKLTGHPPQPLDEFIREHRELFMHETVAA